jgi:hypothetical protein
MVQLADPAWTLKAMHLACAMASRAHTAVVLVRMLAVPHIGLVGEDLGEINLTSQEQETKSICRDLAKDYGVEFEFIDFQYYALADALADASAFVKAQAVFATLPPGMFPFWHKFQVWLLRRKLASVNCRLYTLEPSNGRPESMPSILAHAADK